LSEFSGKPLKVLDTSESSATTRSIKSKSTAFNSSSHKEEG